MLANHCRASLLLEKEHFKLRKAPIWGIEAQPLNDENFLKWQAIIKGPRDSIWEGGIFKVYLSFSEEYNSKPPEVFFHTIPFHPNVDMQNGVPCIDFLNDIGLWKPHYDVVYILLQLQTMLDHPVLENPVNVEAANMCNNRPKHYRQMVLDCVFASKRLEAGLKPQIFSPVKEENSEMHLRPEVKTKAKQQISFEDYHKTWLNIATSKPHTLGGRSNEDTNTDTVVNESHFGVLQEELEEELRRQLSEHNSIMYGRFRDKRLKDEERIANLQVTKAQLLKQIYFKEQDPTNETLPHVTSRLDPDEPFDEEVDQLVSWSEKLPGVLE